MHLYADKIPIRMLKEKQMRVDRVEFQGSMASFDDRLFDHRVKHCEFRFYGERIDEKPVFVSNAICEDKGVDEESFFLHWRKNLIIHIVTKCLTRDINGVSFIDSMLPGEIQPGPDVLHFIVTGPSFGIDEWMKSSNGSRIILTSKGIGQGTIISINMRDFEMEVWKRNVTTRFGEHVIISKTSLFKAAPEPMILIMRNG